jgi:hypothetical protein
MLTAAGRGSTTSWRGLRPCVGDVAARLSTCRRDVVGRGNGGHPDVPPKRPDQRRRRRPSTFVDDPATSCPTRSQPPSKAVASGRQHSLTTFRWPHPYPRLWARAQRRSMFRVNSERRSRRRAKSRTRCMGTRAMARLRQVSVVVKEAFASRCRPNESAIATARGLCNSEFDSARAASTSARR